MKYAIVLVALLLELVVHAHARCDTSSGSCYDESGNFYDKKGCEKNGCCWKGNACYTKPRTGTSAGSAVTASAQVSSLFEETTSKATKRFLTFPGPKCLPPPIEFPRMCRPKINEPYVTEPPLDVPYCVRIPCSLDVFEQRSLDYNHTLCILQPGCYFDAELAEIRTGYPHTLAGTPVCQYAIRSPIFHKYTEKVSAAFGRWNPYYTNCLLNFYDTEITEGPYGCKLIPILEVFHIKAKMAGWGHITSYDCALIGGCWRYGSGCFYPVDINAVAVKSGQRFKFVKNEIQFGRPKCQLFDSSTPITSLQSYHHCLRAGCSVDAYIASNYYYNLYKIGSGMTLNDHWDYWQAVEKGYYGSHNVDSISGKWKYSLTSPPPIPPKPSGPTSGLFPGGTSPASGLFPGTPGGGAAGSLFPGGSGGAGNLFPGGSGSLFPGGGGGGVGQKYTCGIRNPGIFQSRPCSPPTFPNPIYFHKCPYHDVYHARFPRLKGSFTGCCEINLCYLSRRDVRKMHSGPAPYMTNWTYWSKCSVLCGKGTQYRTRECIGGKDKCGDDTLFQKRSCLIEQCKYWGPWAPWTECPRSCKPGGIIQRNRVCQPTGRGCLPDKDGKKGEDVKQCNRRTPCF